MQKTKDISRITAVKYIIGDGSKSLTEFDDDLFEAMVEKLIIRSQTEFDFHFRKRASYKG